jgi:hypothetical protein
MFKRNLLVLTALATVAPASAHHSSSPIDKANSDCPFERAHALAMQQAPASGEAQGMAPSAVVVQATPGTAAVLGLARSSAFMP